eukprot:GHVU01192165.1.p1 GENE.GHVU01192165.1~~GHVU01192165.1.p1  ORF type:complete len:111 (+),score=9.97 GHVU01192165.1:115-447(+)
MDKSANHRVSVWVRSVDMEQLLGGTVTLPVSATGAPRCGIKRVPGCPVSLQAVLNSAVASYDSNASRLILLVAVNACTYCCCCIVEVEGAVLPATVQYEKDRREIFPTTE